MSEAVSRVAVIGMGQAGLSAAYHLQRRGIPSLLLDSEQGPGGAWRHRWDSLTMATVNGIFGLPGMPVPPVDPAERSSVAVPRYFASYERERAFDIRRPVRVERVERIAGGFEIFCPGASWRVRALINATGTWTNPYTPVYPGAAEFRGAQLHAVQYRRAADFAGSRVAIVGGGITAVQLLDELSAVADTLWFTRREPVWVDEFRHETLGREVEAKVAADVANGEPVGSIVSYTGLVKSAYTQRAAARGALVRHPMFVAIEPDGVRLAAGRFEPVDVILWATGFRAALDHLRPLGLDPALGIAMDGTAVAGESMLHLVGYGPNQSTIGANRAGRHAVAALARSMAT
ncbi:NAD(P)-binding domain-containing protein [Rarobacter faecitabidus]|uniref:Pyridine nucleotide-disulfide oxidoreductase n=1 Tax=Rarobacter faecitabidus TaxID=13243 RepID=A0A542ZWD1_RARFA|nr:NAD(P)-binding domain-containing protein [Rarobacter faecitabidus]TQL64673.1 pyridine nucleotide-disulfide oxidoreductase [Rarobacter faecitabidus]